MLKEPLFTESCPIPSIMVALVRLATITVKVTITVSMFPWFRKENSLLPLFCVCHCSLCDMCVCL